MCEKTNALAEMLSKAFGLSWSRAETLSWLIFLILQFGSVCMHRLAAHAPSQTKIASIRQRLRRFFADIILNHYDIAKLIVSCLSLNGSCDGWDLQIDRTNWEYGDTTHNMLVLSVLWNGTAVPLLWANLGKDGNSNTKERIDLFEKFLEIFPTQPINSLTGDREFVGQKWLGWLSERKIPFVLRHKENMFVFRPGMTPVPFAWLARHLKPGETINLKGGWHVGQNERETSTSVFVAIKRLEDGSLLIVVSSHSAKKALAMYKLRWKIETLFGLLKTKGFNLEDTHMKNPQRLVTLFSIIAIAAAISIKTGKLVLKKNPIKIKNHGRPARSIFALGLDMLRKLTAMEGWQGITAAIKQLLQPKNERKALLMFGFLR